MRIRVFILMSLLALLSVACRGVAVREHVAGVAADQPSEQTPAAPPVSGEFQPAIAQLSAEGLRIKEAVEASLEAGARHLAATFERAGAKDPAQRYEFRILESDGRAARTIFRRTDFFFSFAATAELQKLNGTDINGDGLKEILVQSSSGGNCWSCNPTEVYQVRNHRGELIAAGPIQRISDLNGDGTRELIVADARWESYDDLSHAASPTALMVYAWRGGRYVYASKDFADFYRGEIAPEAMLTPADTDDVQVATLAYGLGNWYLLRGDKAQARTWFERSIQSGGWPGFGFIVSEVELRWLH